VQRKQLPYTQVRARPNGLFESVRPIAENPNGAAKRMMIILTQNFDRIKPRRAANPIVDYGGYAKSGNQPT